MKARARLLGITMILPATMGLGLAATAPAYAVSNCAPGTHWVATETSGTCEPDQSAPDQTQPTPVATTAPEVPSPQPTAAPTVPAPVPTATSPAAVPTVTVPAAPAPTVTVTVSPTATEAAVNEAPVGGTGDAPESPVDTPAQQLPGTKYDVPAKSQKSVAPDSTVTSDEPTAESQQVEQASADSGDNLKKVWALGVVGTILALMALIVVYAVETYGPPFPRKH